MGNKIVRDFTYDEGKLQLTEGEKYDGAGNTLLFIRSNFKYENGKLKEESRYMELYMEDPDNLITHEMFTEYTYDPVGNLLTSTYYEDGEPVNRKNYHYRDGLGVESGA